MQLGLSLLATLAIVGIVVAAVEVTANHASIEAEAAGATTKSGTSHVRGKAFDRVAIIWLENTDDSEALNDRGPRHVPLDVL